MIRTTTPRPSALSSREGGSAFIITLMVLFVLTIVGLGLIVTTQTERLIGENDRAVQSAFYAADAGIDMSIAKVLSYNDYKPTNFRMPRVVENPDGSVNTNPNLRIRDEVEVTPSVVLLPSPCDLCQINQGSEYFMLNHGITTYATRRGLADSVSEDDAVPLAQRSVSSMVRILPWPYSTEAYNYPEDWLDKVIF